MSNPFPGGEGIAEAEINFSIPHGGTWFFVWNNVSPSESKEVSANVTWTGHVIEYTEVTRNRSSDEQVYGLIGSIILIAGIIIVSFGLAELFTTYKSNRNARAHKKL